MSGAQLGRFGLQSDNNPFHGSRVIGWRLLTWTAVLLLLIVLLAALFVARVPLPRTVQARFELVAHGALPTVQAPLAGTVTRVAIRQGEAVSAGDLLYEIRGDALHGLKARHSALAAGLAAVAEEGQRLRATHAIALAASEREGGLLRQALARAREHEITLGSLLERKQRAVRDGLLPEISLLDDRLLAADSARERVLAEQHLAQWGTDRQQRVADHERVLQELQLRKLSMEAEFKAAEAMLQNASAGVCQIRATHDAVVLELLVADPETIVAPAQAMARMAHPSHAGSSIQARLQIAEHDVGRLSRGQAVRLLVTAFPYQRHGSVAATLSWISPASHGDPPASGFEALAEFADGRGLALSAGMTGEALILTRRQTLLDRFLEPLRALRERAWIDEASSRLTDSVGPSIE